MMEEHIRQSNLIEGIDDAEEDARSLRAWKWLVKQPDIRHSVIMALQGKITLKQLPAKYRNTYRPIQVYVGRHTPPAPAFLLSMMDEFIEEMNKPSDNIPKELHVKYETIHPFVDGNGRTGRMLMWWHELKRNEAPTLIKADNRHSYYKWFDSTLYA